MLKSVYSVRDIKAMSYMNPMVSANDDTAKRDFLYLVQNEGTMLHQFPEDYELFYLCSYEDTTGKVVDNTVRFVCNAVIQKKETE